MAPPTDRRRPALHEVAEELEVLEAQGAADEVLAAARAIVADMRDVVVECEADRLVFLNQGAPAPSRARSCVEELAVWATTGALDRGLAGRLAAAAATLPPSPTDGSDTALRASWAAFPERLLRDPDALPLSPSLVI